MEEEQSQDEPIEEGRGKPRNDELMIEAKSFFDSYKKDIGESIRRGLNVVFIDFTKLTEFSNKLSEEILTSTKETSI